MLVVAYGGALFLAGIYALTMWAALTGRLHQDWAPALATTVWKSWGFRKRWAWGLARGVMVFYQVSLVLSMAMVCLGYAFSAPYEAVSLPWVVAGLALVGVALLALPALAVAVGKRGRPQRWIHPDVRDFTIDDF